MRIPFFSSSLFGQTIEWTFSQTPQFEFSTHPTAQDERDRPALPVPLPQSLRLYLESRHGEISQFALNTSGEVTSKGEQPQASSHSVQGRLLYAQDWTWQEVVEHSNIDPKYRKSLADWMQTMLPLGLFKT